MRIAVVSEVSAVERNAAIVSALDGRGHDVLNAGMRRASDPELTYIHTGLVAAFLLNAGRADLVVGGCGTGQGFLSSAMQYPGVFGGLIVDPLDGWLFRQINAGNCLSLPLNKGYGWAADVNLRLLFDPFFSVDPGGGYPPARRESQRTSVARLRAVSAVTHRTFSEIVRRLDEAVIGPVLAFPGFLDMLDASSLDDAELRDVIRARAGA